MDVSGPIDLGKSRLLESEGKSRAILIGVFFSSKEKESCNEHLQELNALSDTFGLEVIDKIAVPLKKIESSTFIGSGKVIELAELIEENNIDIVVFDLEISPHQQRNLEKAFKKSVIDRTELILGVFAIHARSKEARLQIKLAQFKYELPRLKRLWTHLSRQRTGGSRGGYLKGAGETQIEIDRQSLKKKISDLQNEIEELIKHRDVLRKKRERSNIPTFAIVGYTNSGKSTLLNALTDAKVLVEDKLFATLDTTTKSFILPNGQQILLIDTVGFIRKLPHTLIASFRSTLEEALRADFLIHLIDASSPNAKNQAIASYEVLKELKALDRPIITCLNKTDKVEDRSILSFFKIEYPNTVEISALKKEGLDDLVSMMIQEISNMRQIVKLKIPQSYYKVVSELIKEGRVISLVYEENNILLEIEIPKSLKSKIALFEI